MTAASVTAAPPPPPEPIRLPLRLRALSAATRGPADGWLIPGGDPALWLNELCAWGVPLDEMELLVIPVSAREQTALGLFVIIPAPQSPAPSHSPLAQPYRRIAERLYLPAGAALDPPVTDAELRELLVWDVQVLHPTVGMIGCNRRELRRVADLLTAPPPAAVDWSRAQPGVAVEARVRSVRLDAPPEIEQFLDESGDDIGQSPTEQLPPLPNESLIRRSAATAAAAGLGALAALTRMLGGAGAGSRPPAPKPAGGATAGHGGDTKAGGGTTGSGFGWIRRLHEWAKQRRAALTKALDEARQRELARLSRMLESDPDRGLRYALPLHSRGSHRGLGARGGALTPRDTNFSLDSLNAGGPADPWGMPTETYQRLAEQYRALANRELNLGRYRRAAYIFATLLGDDASAANALKQGRFFREAAALYRDRLHNAHAAAACLEEGGLLAEAIEQYEALKLYEKVGDLQRRMKQDDRAEAAYRRAVASTLERNDVIEAARLLETKLGAVDESLQLLTDAWPAKPQAISCLRATFELLGRVNRHDEATRRIASLRRGPDPPLTAPLANVLANVATTYPSLDVRAAAADATRVVAGHRLPAAEPYETRMLTNAVARVAVDDRLLPRDANRYLDRVTDATAAKARRADRPAPPRALRREAKSPQAWYDHAFVLSPAARWRTAVADGSTFYAQGFTDDHVIVVQGTWDGQTRHVAWRDLQGVATSYRLDPLSPSQLLVVPRHAAAARPLRQSLPPSGPFVGRVSIGYGSALANGFIFDAAHDGGLVWALHATAPPEEGRPLLSAFDQNNGNLHWSGVPPIDAVDSDAIETIGVCAGRGYTCVTCGSVMHVLAHALGPDRWLPPIDLGRPIRSVTASPPHTRLRFVACFDEGGRIVWPQDHASEPFGASLIDPVACITADGYLWAIGRQRGIVYRVGGGDVELVSTFAARNEPPIAITPARQGCACFYSEGLVQLLSVK